MIIELALAALLHTSPDWDALAACESSGNWSIHTGNGYSGGIQFHPRTWTAYKPPGAPAHAWQATKAQQIQAGVRVLAVQGPNAWPTCSRKTGWYRR